MRHANAATFALADLLFGPSRMNIGRTDHRVLNQRQCRMTIVRYGIVPLLFIVACVGPWFLWLLGVQT